MGKAKNETIWVANDGQKFRTEETMLAHEGALLYEQHVDQYLANLHLNIASERAQRARKTQMKRIILAYLASTIDPEDMDAD